MQEYTPGEDIYFEDVSSEKAKIIRIYLHKWKNEFIQNPKCFAEYYLEQVLDDDNNVISETIKENPYCVD